MGSFVSALSDWWHKPFSSDQDVVKWTLFVGMVLAAILFWMIVLSHLRNVKLG